MKRVRVTSKGQVTIPKEVREALELDRGDYLLFELPDEEKPSSARIVKGERLTNLYGALPATRPFPGKDAVREEVGRDLGRKRAERERV